MKRLLQNKGNILFASVIFFVVLLLGVSLYSLIATYGTRHLKQTTRLYDAYNYESCARYILAEVRQELGSLQTTVFYSPLQSSRDTQVELQTALWNAVIAPSDLWTYSKPLPIDMRRYCSDYQIYLSGHRDTVNDCADTKSHFAIAYPEVTVKVVWSNYTYEALLSGLVVDYCFYDGLVHCNFNISDAIYKGGVLKHT